ncbi:MAG: GTP cyclohydrolase I FolE2 [Proteobacteria bacterium]|nr:GTP cyclohydrolase I FolE2 [Pseudomonadota bacterium]MBU1716992.1 GTP cyclohydrolase I FolE2 [Pseudomonadota bacterium]
MKDIQSQRDHRRINIKKVGVKNISYPITVLDKSKKVQKTVATVNMYVNLPHQFKGTHMSRFIEILNHFHGEINLKSFHLILAEMKTRLQAKAAHMEIEFPYFLKKKSGNPNTVGICKYQCRMHGSLVEEDDLILEIQVPIAPPAPAQIYHRLPRSLGHWGLADISLRFRHFIWIEDIITMVEEVTSHNLVWPNDNSNSLDSYLSVEKITKALGEKFSGHQDISWFSITVKNFAEGLSTFASLEGPG